MSDKNYDYENDEEYEFEQIQNDRNKTIGGIAGGLIGLLAVGAKAYGTYKNGQKEDALRAERQDLKAELNSYENKLFSFMYEDEKNNLRKKIKDIDNKLKG